MFEGGVCQYGQYGFDLIVMIKTIKNDLFFLLFWFLTIEIEVPELWSFLMVILAISYV